MASAGLLKVLHSGLQDERLLPPRGQPKLDTFQTVFVKAGRFTTEWYRVDFDNRPAFGTTAKATLPRRGHLITRAYLVATLPDIRTAQLVARAEATATGLAFAGPTFGWTNSLGHALVQQAQLTIGANPIDTLDSRLLEVLDEFHTPLEKVTTVNRMLGRADSGFTAQTNGWGAQPQQVAVPLPFWFNRGDPAAALPIDAIGTDAVQISITFNTVANLFASTARQKDAAGNLIVWPALGSKFYAVDPSGVTLTNGLNGNPDLSVRTRLLSATMPTALSLQDSYLLLEYVYVDKPEANRIRLGDLSYPMVQHYAFPPSQTPAGTPQTRIRLRVPNPTRELYIHCHRTDADLLNAPFLATRDLSGLFVKDISGIGPVAPWWPDADGLNTSAFRPLIPAYSQTDSEPITSLALTYEGRLVRYASDKPAFFRSILPSFEQRKTPWHNKYYYHLPFGTQHEFTGVTNPMGHANLDKIQNIDLSLQFKPFRGSLRATDVPAYSVYVWAETYNILRVYGGRAGLLFAY